MTSLFYNRFHQSDSVVPLGQFFSAWAVSWTCATVELCLDTNEAHFAAHISTFRAATNGASRALVQTVGHVTRKKEKEKKNDSEKWLCRDGSLNKACHHCLEASFALRSRMRSTVHQQQHFNARKNTRSVGTDTSLCPCHFFPPQECVLSALKSCHGIPTFSSTCSLNVHTLHGKRTRS